MSRNTQPITEDVATGVYLGQELEQVIIPTEAAGSRTRKQFKVCVLPVRTFNRLKLMAPLMV
jgi:hypothetical protein